jgi:hypothetical protein
MRPLWSAPAGANHELGYQLGSAYLSLVMKTRNEIKRLTEAVRRARAGRRSHVCRAEACFLAAGHL